MYQVTALLQDEEVGYAEAETFIDAIRDAAESVSYMADDVVLHCISMGRPHLTMSLSFFREFFPE